MGATNTTTYYNLSQFVGTDKPAWLQDYNGDMLKIDTGINAAKVAADNAANAASAAQGDATTALGDISSLNTTVGTISGTLNTAVGNINTINSLIGNGTPTTTDQTIIGAINEVNAHINGVDSALRLKSYTHFYDVAEVARVVADGVKTAQQLLSELHSQFASYLSNSGDNVFFTGVCALTRTGEKVAECPIVILNKNTALGNLSFTDHLIANDKAIVETFQIDPTLANCHWSSFDIGSGGSGYYNNDSNVPASGMVWTIEASRFVSGDPVLS